MKNIYIMLMLSLAIVWSSCEDDSTKGFEVDTTNLQLSFTPYAGGAIMSYKLPADPNIHAIKARYQNEFGENVTLQGTYLNNSLDFTGFAHAQASVPVTVTLVNSEGAESEARTEHFSTLISPAIEMFEDITVTSYWRGFKVTIPAIEDENARTGKLNIYYVGISPVTLELDTLSAFGGKPYSFQSYADTLLYTGLDSTFENVTVVIKSEDNKGHFVKQQIYENIATPHPVKLDPSEFTFSTKAETETIDGRQTEFHENYLFDGDTKGSTCLYGQNSAKLYTYQTKPGMEFDDETNVFSLSLKEAKGLAWVRIYVPLNINIPTFALSGSVYTDYFKNTPSHVIVYGASSVDAPESEWEELTSFYQDWSGAEAAIDEGKYAEYYSQWWWFPCSVHSGKSYRIEEAKEFEEAIPAYLQINCPLEKDKEYACYKIRVKETFSTGKSASKHTGIIAMHELEIFVRE